MMRKISGITEIILEKQSAKGEKMRKRILSLTLSFAVLLSSMSMSAVSVSSANVEETAGTQLQTILLDNDGKNLWVTESWGGANIIPNTIWTTSDLYDYFYNGSLSFEVQSSGQTSFPFRIGITSHSHNEDVTVNWTDLEKYQNAVTASPEWTSYTLPLYDLAEIISEKGFDKHNVWKISVGAVPSGESASFRNMKISSDDEERQYPFIKVNQVGYTCEGEKNAKVSCFAKFGSLSGKRYEVVNKDSGKVAYSNMLSDAVADETISGESVYEINFDAVIDEGTYFIRIPNADLNTSALTPRDKEEDLKTDTIVSVPFEIGDDVYDEMLSDMSKYYYYQRQGIDLEEKYAGEFARKNLHPNDVSVRRWSDRDNPNAETFDVSQGWYDAGDYGKYVSPAATSVENLLLAYELFPQEFRKLDPNILETDKTSDRYSDSPAILSEIKWELDMLLKLEHPDKDGSFYVAANYKDGTIYIEDTLYSTSDYTSGAQETDLRSHLATADMAAMLAHAYLVYKDILAYADFAEQCLETAVRAWNWVTDSSNEKHMSIGAANRTYTFTQDELDRSMYWAAGALYRASKTAGNNADVYENYLIANCENENVNTCFTGSSLGYSHKGRAFLGFFHYLYQNDAPSDKIKTVFSKFEPWRKRILNYDSFGTDYPDWGYWWGSNMVLAQSSMTLLLGSMVTEGSDSIPDAVLHSNQSAFNYILGVNPVSFSYVSGYGENSVKNIYSAIYTKDAKLTPYKCPDGYVTEGANSTNNRHLSKYNGKCYMDSDAEWTTNENTIYGNAAFILLTAAVMSQTETDPVQGDVNADGKFDIADIVTLQKWLLAVPGVQLADWKAADLYADGKVDVFDLCMMRQKLFPAENTANQIHVKNTEELKTALENAKAGDEIILAEGEYVYSGETPKGYMFTGSADGTKENPIVIRSENPEKPAILSGSSTAENYVLSVSGDWWEIRDLKVTNAQKGIMLDNSNHTTISNCEVYNIGSEGIHLRDNSSSCLIEDCSVHDTGVVSPGYGEAIYVGSAQSTTGYGYECDNNTIRNCKLGPNVAAEHIDIKEYTTGTTVENCTFDGTGMSGENYAKSFINIKGNDCVIRNNIGYRNGCTAIQRAFEQNNVADGWGQNAMVYGNKVYMDTATNALGKKMYFLNAWDCSATVWDNFMAYDGELFSVDNEDDQWDYYNCNLLTYGNK